MNAILPPPRVTWLVAFAVTTVLAILPASAPAQNETTDAATSERLAQYMVEEPPRGFTAAAPQGPPEPALMGGLAVGHQRVFMGVGVRRHTVMGLMLWDPTSRAFGTDFVFGKVEVSAARGGAFDARGIAADAIGRRWTERVDGRARVVHDVVVRHGRLIVQAQHLAPPSYPVAAVRTALRELVTRQLVEPTMPALQPAVPQSAAYLYDILVDRPGVAPSGRRFILLPSLSGVVTPERLRLWESSLGNLAAWRDHADDIRVVRRNWAEPERATQLVVTVFDLGGDGWAGRALHGAAQGGWPVPGRPDTVGMRRPAAEPGHTEYVVIGRQERYLVGVSASGAEPGKALLALAARTLDRQRERLPAGETHALGTNDFRLDLVLALVFSFAMLAALRLIGGLIARRRLRINDPSQGEAGVVCTADRARGLRRTGILVGAALAATATVALGGLALPSPATLSVSAAAFAMLPAIVILRRRAERPERWARVGLRRPRLIRSVLVGAASVVVLGLSALLVLATALSSILGPNLAIADLEREYGTHIQSISVPLLLLLVAILSLVASGLFQLARREARLRATELRELDDRPPVLYLRGFADDRLKLPSIVSGRRPLVELLSPAPRDAYEAVVAWELDATGPTIAIAPPKGDLRNRGAARLYTSGADWTDAISPLMRESAIIAVSLGATKGVLWELAHLAELGLLERVLLLMPPVPRAEASGRWKAAATALRAGGAGEHQLPIASEAVLVAAIENGRTTAYTADQRDEAGYRTAIRAALARQRRPVYT